jgi:hypothetical protein
MQNIKHSRILRRFGSHHYGSAMLRLSSLLAFAVMLIAIGCATTHATLVVTAPSITTAGTPFTITVTAMYAGKRDTIINSIVQFTSSDSAAILPGYYKFTAADAGSHTWPNGVTLMTPGNQTITATVLMETGITTTVNVNVTAGAASNSQSNIRFFGGL